MLLDVGRVTLKPWVGKQIQLAKELDGIDTTNIVRGRRRNQDEEDAADAPSKNKYRIRAVSDSDSDDSS